MTASETKSPSDDPEDSSQSSVQRIIRDTLLFTVAIMVGVAIAGWLFREPLTDIAGWLIDTLGVGGMFFGVFIADAFTFPLPPDFYLFISIASGFDVVITLMTCSLSSVIAGNVAYFVGPQIQRIPLLSSRLEAFRERGEALFKRWGVWAVGVAALTPVPFSIVSWLAGIYRMRWRLFVLASLLRIPRVIGYYLLYKAGWAPGM